MASEGRKRVIIENVFPEIDGGKYPLKRVPGEKIDVKAFVISDGHDHLTVSLCWRHESENNWNQKEMKLLYNDEWTGDFRVEKRGTYFYTVKAWVDHFKTWRAGINKKLAAKVDVTVDLIIGMNMLEHASLRATGADAGLLKSASKALCDRAKNYEAVYTDTVVETAASRYPDQEIISTYAKELPVFVEREKALFSTWFELFPRSTSGSSDKHGTFRDTEKMLPLIKEMGFDVLYFPPIHPVGEKNRKGKNNALKAGKDDHGSPWAVGSKDGGHKAVNPLLGTMEDFERLVKKANAAGIEVALDIAFQCAPDHPYLKDHPEWFHWRPDGSIQYAENPPKKYEDIVPFSFECKEWKALWDELKSIFIFWAAKGVRNFRVDNPHTKSFAFWEWCIAEVKKEYPDALFLAEAFTRPKLMHHLAKAGFTQSYTYFTWRNTKQEIEEYINELAHTGSREYFLPNFWPNTPDILHDYLVHGGRAGHIIRLVLASTLCSNYGIYGGAYITCQTEPYPGKEEYNNNEKYELKNWDLDAPGNIKNEVALINKIRKENPALQTTWNVHVRGTDNTNIVFYTKCTEDLSNIIMVAVNLDPHAKQSGFVSVPVYDLRLSAETTYQVEDLYSGRTFEWRGEWNYVELDPAISPVHILRVKKSDRAPI